MFLRQGDRDREDRIADRLEAAWGIRLIHMPRLSYIDFIGCKHDRPVCWVEVITRNYDHERLMDMGGVALKLETYNTLSALAAIPISTDWRGGFMVWDLRDDLYWINVNEISTAGSLRTIRDPRGAVNDTETVVLVRSLHRVRAHA